MRAMSVSRTTFTHSRRNFWARRIWFGLVSFQETGADYPARTDSPIDTLPDAVTSTFWAGQLLRRVRNPSADQQALLLARRLSAGHGLYRPSGRYPDRAGIFRNRGIPTGRGLGADSRSADRGERQHSGWAECSHHSGRDGKVWMVARAPYTPRISCRVRRVCATPSLLRTTLGTDRHRRRSDCAQKAAEVEGFGNIRCHYEGKGDMSQDACSRAAKTAGHHPARHLHSLSRPGYWTTQRKDNSVVHAVFRFAERSVLIVHREMLNMLEESTGMCCGSAAQIAIATDLALCTVKRARKELLEAGLWIARNVAFMCR